MPHITETLEESIGSDTDSQAIHLTRTKLDIVNALIRGFIPNDSI